MSEAAKDGCLPRIFRMFGNQTVQPEVTIIDTQEKSYPYHIRDFFLSPAEIDFYRVLQQIVQARVVIMAKVRLADIFFVERPNDNYSAFGKISQKHVDFLLCHPLSLKPVCGIELDDSSHQRADRAERDKEVDAIFQAAALPLIHFPVRRTFNPETVAAQLNDYLPAVKAPVPADMPLASVDKVQSSPACPKCGSQMILRTAKQGKNAGSQFWSCSRYPECRGTLNLSEVTKA